MHEDVFQLETVNGHKGSLKQRLSDLKPYEIVILV